MSITLNAAHLARTLANAAIFSDTDATVPVLCSVHLELRDGYLIATSTDRYQLAEQRLKADELDGAGLEPVILHTDDLKAFLPVLKAAKGAFITLHNEDWANLGYSGVHTGTIPTTHGDYPKVGRLLEDNLEKVKGTGAIEVLGLNPQYLANLGRIRDLEKGKPATAVHLAFSAPNKPVVWHIGDHARGMIMPLRLEDAGDFGW